MDGRSSRCTAAAARPTSTVPARTGGRVLAQPCSEGGSGAARRVRMQGREKGPVLRAIGEVGHHGGQGLVPVAVGQDDWLSWTRRRATVARYGRVCGSAAGGSPTVDDDGHRAVGGAQIDAAHRRGADAHRAAPRRLRDAPAAALRAPERRRQAGCLHATEISHVFLKFNAMVYFTSYSLHFTLVY